MKKKISLVLIFIIGLAYFYALACKAEKIDAYNESLASNYDITDTYNY